MKTTPCRGCGRPIVFVFVYDPAGIEERKRIPLDMRPPIYIVTDRDHEGTPIAAKRQLEAGVSHFATCPKASEFSKGRKP